MPDTLALTGSVNIEQIRDFFAASGHDSRIGSRKDDAGCIELYRRDKLSLVDQLKDIFTLAKTRRANYQIAKDFIASKMGDSNLPKNAPDIAKGLRDILGTHKENFYAGEFIALDNQVTAKNFAMRGYKAAALDENISNLEWNRLLTILKQANPDEVAKAVCDPSAKRRDKAEVAAGFRDFRDFIDICRDSFHSSATIDFLRMAKFGNELLQALETAKQSNSLEDMPFSPRDCLILRSVLRHTLHLHASPETNTVVSGAAPESARRNTNAPEAAKDEPPARPYPMEAREIVCSGLDKAFPMAGIDPELEEIYQDELDELGKGLRNADPDKVIALVSEVAGDEFGATALRRGFEEFKKFVAAKGRNGQPSVPSPEIDFVAVKDFETALKRQILQTFAIGNGVWDGVSVFSVEGPVFQPQTWNLLMLLLEHTLPVSRASNFGFADGATLHDAAVRIPKLPDYYRAETDESDIPTTFPPEGLADVFQKTLARIDQLGQSGAPAVARVEFDEELLSKLQDTDSHFLFEIFNRIIFYPGVDFRFVLPDSEAQNHMASAIRSYLDSFHERLISDLEGGQT